MLITFDFETYYDREYSLRSMTPVEYILDPRFEMIGCAVKEGRDQPVFMEDRDFRRYLMGIDAKEVDAISHNALFDMCILAWRYGFVPRFMIDTLGMSRALLSPYLRTVSLDAVTKFLKLKAKGDTIHKVMGMNARMIQAAGLWQSFAEYACDDADNAYDIFRELMRRGFPKDELLVMDTVLRCAVLPAFRLDTETLYQHMATVQQAKAELLASVNVNKDTLMSNDKFAEALKDLGVDPPTKTSLATGKETWAFSKTDVDFNDLQEHEDPRVQALVAARLGTKSTLEETRTQRLINISQLEWNGLPRRYMPIPLKYSGAHTHRLCLVGDTTICVLRDNRVVYDRLDHLQGTDLVWDGEAFVHHGGLAYAGLKEVIEHDGVVGTPDHRVWTVEQRYRELADAKARGTHIARGAVPDATRIDPSVQWSSDLPKQDQVPLCEVRPGSVVTLGDKDRTISQPLLVPTWDIVDCGPRNRFMANGRIVHNSGDWKLNMQNLPRGGMLRRALRVTEKQRIVAVDASQIEARLVAWFAGQLDLTEAFAKGDDVYSLFASSIYGFPVDKKNNPVERFVGKQCLAEGTLVLTDTGWKPIQYVGVQDKLWDGTQWVSHKGLIDKGLKEVQTAYGLTATWDHEILTEHGWQAWSVVHTSHSLFQSALSMASLPSQVFNATSDRQDAAQTLNSGCVSLRQKSQVYDLADAGPNHRFTVLTDVGPVIVHNCILGLGYGLGWKKFGRQIRVLSRNQTGQEIILTEVEAQRIVGLYREMYYMIPMMWRVLNAQLPLMTRPDHVSDIKCVSLRHEHIMGPSGLPIRYHNLRFEEEQWKYEHAGKTKRIYGGAVLENIIQYLARIHVMDAAIRVRRTLEAAGLGRIRLVLQAHDELVYVCPADQAEYVYGLVLGEMNRRPQWGLDAPLTAEGGIGLTYADVK